MLLDTLYSEFSDTLMGVGCDNLLSGTRYGNASLSGVRKCLAEGERMRCCWRASLRRPAAATPIDAKQWRGNGR